MADPNPTPTSPAAAPTAPAAPAATPPATPQDTAGWIDEHLESHPELSEGINDLMELSRSDPGAIARFATAVKAGFNVASPAAPPATVPATVSTPAIPNPQVPDISAAVLAALGGKDRLDLLSQAAEHLSEQKAKAEMDQTYGRLQGEAKGVVAKVHPTYFGGAIGEKVARLAVERSLRTGERLEAAAEAEAKEFLAASNDLGKQYVEALSPEGRRMVLTAGLQGGPPPNFDPSKMTVREQEDAMTAIFADELTKARHGL